MASTSAGEASIAAASSAVLPTCPSATTLNKRLSTRTPESGQ